MSDTKNLKAIAIKTGWTIEELRKAFSPSAPLETKEANGQAKSIAKTKTKPALRINPPSAGGQNELRRLACGPQRKFAPLPSTPHSAVEDYIRAVPPICEDALHLLHLQLIEAAVQTISGQGN